MVIADRSKTAAVVVVSSSAARFSQGPADDLVHFIGLMTGAKPALANTDEAAAFKADAPALVVGTAALAAEPSLRPDLDKVAKKDPVLRADAVVLRRRGKRVLLAGTNDDSHYYAAAELLHRGGCRWYLPTEFGECVPEAATLTVGKLDHAYAPPFEVRDCWIAWNGSPAGAPEFLRRNRFAPGVGVPSGHAIGKYVKELIPPGKTVHHVPIAEDATADHVAKMVGPQLPWRAAAGTLGEEGSRSDRPPRGM